MATDDQSPAAGPAGDPSTPEQASAPEQAVEAAPTDERTSAPEQAPADEQADAGAQVPAADEVVPSVDADPVGTDDSSAPSDAPAAGATAAAAPTGVPGPARVPAPPAGTAAAQRTEAPWGRVAEDGTVYVREGDGERAVGQYPDATPAEALAYYERKYAELQGQVSLLEQRLKGGASASDASRTVAHLREQLVEPSAVGDLQSLRDRVAALGGTVGELTRQQSAEAQAAQREAVAYRTSLVEEAEALAAQDPARVQWKQVTASLDDVFARWQRHQQEGPRIPKGEGNDLWKRFRTARSTIDQHRKAFYADLDAQHRQARQRKQALVEQAEGLAPRGSDGIPSYRGLLDEWKRAGRAGKKYDDSLWARFKAAGDVLYAAKNEVAARDAVEYDANLQAKLALLDEAETILTVTDRGLARDRLTDVQLRWDEIGRVPRESLRTVEDRLRAVETHVRKLDEDHWRTNDPERTARSQGLASQLEDAIAKLEAELRDAEASGDARRVKDAREALDARRVWLDALGR